MNGLGALDPVFSTREIAPVEFELKRQPGDFQVDELPLYEPCGEGDHLYLHIEKRDRTTLQVIAALARALGRKRREFGYAGMKDRHGVTTQWVSIEHVQPDAVKALELADVRILEAKRHRNKLRLGHLSGNRFRIALRGLRAEDLPAARECLSRLEEHGLPNWFGEQRFGRRANGHELGAWLLGREWREYLVTLVQADCEGLDPAPVRAAIEGADGEALRDLAGQVNRGLAQVLTRLAGGATFERAVQVVPAKIRELHLSALQSHLFNQLLSNRLADESLRCWQPLDGEVFWIHGSGACFLGEEQDEETLSRIHSFEISPAGPLPGRKLLAAAGECARREDAVLAGAGLDREAFGRAGLRGARRPYRVPVRDIHFEEVEGVTWLEFSLPKGSYATAVVAELRKRFSGRDSGGETARSGAGGAESSSS